MIQLARSSLSGTRLYEPARSLWLWTCKRKYWRAEAETARFYRQFVRPGDLCFDVGANVGEITRALLAIGARVIAIEPQPRCAAAIAARFASHPRLTIVQAALGSAIGEAEMLTTDRSELATLSPRWTQEMKSSHRFGEIEWRPGFVVPVTTLDHLVETYGKPRFCKIDVEGFELEVLRGLNTPAPALTSFECQSEVLDTTLACVERLATLAPAAFNFSNGRSHDWTFPTWQASAAFKDGMRELARRESFWGDVYATFEPLDHGR